MLKNRITISISRISVSVMSLPCFAWLISVSICLGGISTQLDGNSHDDNSRLLQITLVAFHEGVEKFTGFGQSGAGATYFID